MHAVEHNMAAVRDYFPSNVSEPLHIYTGCPRRNVPDFGRVFLTLKYTDITQKHLCPKLNGYGDNDQSKVWSPGGSTHCTCHLTVLSMSVLEYGVI
jgi:hypothetical protein